MNKEEIMNILPHRDNMLLLDDVENIDGTAVGHYLVRGDEFFLKGHGNFKAKKTRNLSLK